MIAFDESKALDHRLQLAAHQRSGSLVCQPILILGVVLDPSGGSGRQDAHITAISEGGGLQHTLQLVPDLTQVRDGQVPIRQGARGAVRVERASGDGGDVLVWGGFEGVRAHHVHGQRDLVAQRRLERVHDVEVAQITLEFRDGNLEPPLGDRDLLRLDGRTARGQTILLIHPTRERELEDSSDGDALALVLAIPRFGAQELHELNVRDCLSPDVTGECVIFVRAGRSIPEPRHF